MDRWQRLRFGRRATSNPPEDKKPTVDSELTGKRSSDKLERLREITELLKVSRNNTDPSQSCCSNDTLVNQSHEEIPPIPPPRKPRTSLCGRNSGSIEKFIDTSASESGSPVLSTKFDHSSHEKGENATVHQNMFQVPTPPPLPSPPVALRPNASATNLEYILKIRDKEKPMLTLPEENSNETTTKIVPATKTDATIHRSANINSYQKSVPFRSASFSQIDYSSGKYIRSALGALKASLSKAKSPPLSFACRRERSESSSPDEAKSNECTDIWIPLKGPCDKRNDLNLDLINASATILEEDSEHSPTSNNSDAAATTTEAVVNESTISLKMINAAQMTTDSPHDESTTIQGVDNYFQSASACLIPVPVYECAHSDDSILADKWINACEVDSESVLSNYNITDTSLIVDTSADQIPAFSEIQSEQSKRDSLYNANTLIDSDKRILKNKNSLTANENISKKLRRRTQTPTLDIDGVPSIAVTPGSSVSGSSFEEIDNNVVQQPNQSEFGVEVRKRYSNDVKTIENRSDDSNQSTSTSGTNSPKSQHNEKRRIDKSKRRKGMYIQWATLDKHNKELNAVSWTVGDGPSDELCERNVPEMDARSEQPVWPTETKAASTVESIYTPPALYNSGSIGFSCDGAQSTSASCDTFTPDSDYNQRPLWPRNSIQIRRQSLSLQSSEEKDDASSPPILSKPRSKIFLIRSDSISDNEVSDRTPPPRDRTSQSPAPDYDLKRYSKRPLRGPYGQMLEAEMKKPAKQNYDGLLEELNRSERLEF